MNPIAPDARYAAPTCAAALLALLLAGPMNARAWNKTEVGRWTIDAFIPAEAEAQSQAEGAQEEEQAVGPPGSTQMTDRPYCFLYQAGDRASGAPEWLPQGLPPLFLTRLKVGPEAEGGSPQRVEVWILSLAATELGDIPPDTKLVGQIDASKVDLEYDEQGVYYALFAAEPLAKEGSDEPLDLQSFKDLDAKLRDAKSFKLTASGTSGATAEFVSLLVSGHHSSTKALNTLNDCWKSLGFD
jgi:hypothetical protein